MEVEIQRPAVDRESTDFDSFFREHFAKLARAAALVVRDVSTGQDLAQEAFVRLHPRWSEMESLDHARNFLYRVAINLARSHLRKYLRLSLIGFWRHEERNPVPDATTRTDDWLQVAQALDGLSSRQRACVVMIDYVDMEPAEAGRILGIRPETVRVHLMRGRRALKEQLAGTSVEEER
jgi:RNA polymerase sigma factor (sigma-70 family)